MQETVIMFSFWKHWFRYANLDSIHARYKKFHGRICHWMNYTAHSLSSCHFDLKNSCSASHCSNKRVTTFNNERHLVWLGRNTLYGSTWQNSWNVWVSLAVPSHIRGKGGYTHSNVSLERFPQPLLQPLPLQFHGLYTHSKERLQHMLAMQHWLVSWISLRVGVMINYLQLNI